MKRQEKKAWIDVRKLRAARAWRQSETAEALGVTRAYLSAMENGKRGISLNMMMAIMRVFDVKFEDFFGSNQGRAVV